MAAVQVKITRPTGWWSDGVHHKQGSIVSVTGSIGRFLVSEKHWGEFVTTDPKPEDKAVEGPERDKMMGKRKVKT